MAVQEGWALIRGCWRYLKPGVKNRTHVDCTINAPGASFQALMAPLIAIPLVINPVPEAPIPVPVAGYSETYGPEYLGPYREDNDFWGLGSGFGGIGGIGSFGGVHGYNRHHQAQGVVPLPGAPLVVADNAHNHTPDYSHIVDSILPGSSNVIGDKPVINVPGTQITNPVVDVPVNVPEPASAALLGVGLLGLFFVRKKKVISV